MDKHSLDNIKLINKDYIELSARYLPSQNLDTVIMYCPGFGGGYGNIGELLSDIAQKNGYGYLFCQFKDSYDVIETVKHLNNGEVQKEYIGATNSRLYKSIVDFDCFFDFLYSQGYKNIVAVGLCGSASKLTYYLQHNQMANNMVSELILLAPQDFIEVRTSSVHEGLEQEAIDNVKQGYPNKILSKKFLGYMDISSITYLDVSLNKTFNTLSYKTNTDKLKDLRLIDGRILFVMGSLDFAIRNEDKNVILKYFNSMIKNCKDGKFYIIDNAKHLFKGKEQELAEIIEKFINLRTKEIDNVY